MPADLRVDVWYNATGVSAAVRGLVDREYDFVIVDWPLDHVQDGELPTDIIRLPLAISPYVVVCNLPMKGRVVLDGEALADIYLGNIVAWSDPKLVALNPNAELPDIPIVPIGHVGRSGVSLALTVYLSDVSREWSRKHGVLETLPSTACEFSQTVVLDVSRQVGAIAMVEHAFAGQHPTVRTATLVNRDGHEVNATVASVQSAVMHATGSGDSLVVNPVGERSYPLQAVVSVLVRVNEAGPLSAASLKGFLEWALSHSQKCASDVGLVPLPGEIAAESREALEQLGCGK